MRDPWIVRPRPRPGATLRLFCFPHAGTGASAYRVWPAACPSSLDVVLLQPPGREGRWLEKPVCNLDDLVAAATAALLPWLDLPFAFFGHSLGALTCFEVARRLRRHGHVQPSHLFVSAHRAPDLPHLHSEIRQLSDRDFIDAIAERYGGIPRAVLDDRDLLKVMLPGLRADFTAFETYRFRHEPPITRSITTFAGSADRSVSEVDVDGWRRQTTGRFRTEVFDGDHFFHQSCCDELLNSLMRDLNQAGLVPASALGARA